MKQLRYISGLLVAFMVLITSCRDFVEPNIPYSEFDTGTYLRTISRTSVTFNFFDLQNSRFALTLEAVDAEGGTTVETVDITVRHLRVGSTGLIFTPTQEVVVKTLTASDFQPSSESRFTRASFEITGPEALAAVGLSADDIEGGDFFDFRLVLNTTDGRTFSNNTRSADIEGGNFYQSPFFYRVGVVCPSVDEDWVGTYSTVANGGFGNGSGGVSSPYSNLNYEIEITTTDEDGVFLFSDMSFGLYPELYGDDIPEGRFQDVCGAILDVGDTDQYGDRFVIEGERNPDTGVITLSWSNSWGDRGDVVLTPQ